MPFNLAQWTGIAVTAIVVSGSDVDVVYAVPLGLFAGALATFCCALADHYRPKAQPISAKPSQSEI
jgi:hypothetical protein